jgi:hypothetical protein
MDQGKPERLTRRSLSGIFLCASKDGRTGMDLRGALPYEGLSHANWRRGRLLYDSGANRLALANH